ncbi:MAG TPA: flagellar hook-length control protein FliK [Methylophilaceae bacterium]|nr:flagellar hook-length control protein FliK [Methylophilaceae bacterium]
MILKQPALDAITTGINPVARILPVLAIDGIGGTLQELGARAAQFVKGQEYTGQILAKVSDTAYNVKVEGGDIKGAILKMELGSAAQTGQTLVLKYLQGSPVPTFLLTQNTPKNSGSSLQLSPAAQLLGQYLQAAEGEGVSTRYEATAIVTHSPKNPQVLAQDLKQAVSSSGLFYESHLGDVVQGSRTLAAIAQEPQNQSNSPLAALMSQQLAILENQRMSWHGEVWPGQKMAWDVYLQERGDADAKYTSSEQPSDEDAPISSELTLHLPHLGKVSAHLSLIDGRMRVNIMAEQPQTLDTLKSQRLSLAEAIGKNGQQLDALTVAAHE